MAKIRKMVAKQKIHQKKAKSCKQRRTNGNTQCSPPQVCTYETFKLLIRTISPIFYSRKRECFPKFSITRKPVQSALWRAFFQSPSF